MNNTGDYVDVLAIEELPEGQNRAIDLSGQSILLCHVGGEVYAVSNECTHQHQMLEGGRMRANCIFCPLHGVRFDLRTGAPTGNLTRVPLKTWAVQVVDGRIQVKSTPKGEDDLIAKTG